MSYTTIDDPSAYFQTTLYSGTGSQQSITNGGNSDLQPDWLWIKERNGTSSHQLVDSVRGFHLRVESNNNSAELDAGQAGATNQNVTSFNSDGFGVKNGGAVNESGKTYVAWQWKKQAGVFDIITYEGTGSAQNISHNLGVVPTMIIIKDRDNSRNWGVYNVGMGNTSAMYLDLSNDQGTEAGWWNNTTPTSSVFTVNTRNEVNAGSQSFVSYLVGNKQGVSQCGVYTGNGSNDGTFVYTGFSVGWLIIKRIAGSTGSWLMVDSKRDPFNSGGSANELGANEGNASNDLAGDFKIDLLSNGFKLRDDLGDANAGANYIYMAFADQPLVTSKGVPATAK